MFDHCADGVGVLQKRLPRLRELDAKICSLEQLDAEVFLKRLDLAGDRRLRDEKPDGRAAEAALFRDCDEIFQLTQIHAEEGIRLTYVPLPKKYWTELSRETKICFQEPDACWYQGSTRTAAPTAPMPGNEELMPTTPADAEASSGTPSMRADSRRLAGT
jgi:hypothetical protein